VTKTVNAQLIEISIQTAIDNKNSEVKWLINLETESSKLFVKHITPTDPDGTNEYLAYFKGRDLFLERMFHEKDGTWNVMRFHWKLTSANEVRIITEHQYSDGKKSTSLIFNARRIPV